jgi:hypothetical protein
MERRVHQDLRRPDQRGVVVLDGSDDDVWEAIIKVLVENRLCWNENAECRGRLGSDASGGDLLGSAPA